MTIKLAKGNKDKGESEKMQKVIVSGHFDKHETINELEDFAAKTHIPEDHPDMKIKYEKHCDGWRGILSFEGKEDDPTKQDEKLLKAVKALG